MESVFYFDQINNAGIFNVRIVTSDLVHPPKYHPVFSPSQDPGDHLSPLQLFPRSFQHNDRISHGAEIWLPELDLQVSFSEFPAMCVGEIDWF